LALAAAADRSLTSVAAARNRHTAACNSPAGRACSPADSGKVKAISCGINGYGSAGASGPDGENGGPEPSTVRHNVGPPPLRGARYGGRAPSLDQPIDNGRQFGEDAGSGR
jgi:hypothetical protein